MSSTARYYFFLPHLIVEGLVEDDSDCYALCLYPRDLISSSVMAIISEYAKSNALNTERKKRVKIIMEHLAVALSMKIQYCSHITTARNIYRSWIEDPSLFGDSARQNKYIQRIIKQLSLPFDMNEPTSPHHFKNIFYPLLNSILADYNYMVQEKGSTYSKETLTILFNVCVGIADRLIGYNFTSLLSENEAHDLRATAIDNCCVIIESCGMRDDDIWDRFTKYMKKWSENRSTIKTWGLHVQHLHAHVLNRLYKTPIEEKPLKGVYTESKAIDDSMLFFVFRKILFSINQAAAAKSSKLLKLYSDTLENVYLQAKDTADKASTLIHVLRFPAIAFLKLFGTFLTSVPVLDDDFDSGTATIVSTIMRVLSHFEYDPADPVIQKLILYCIERVVNDHPQTTVIFLKHVSDVYIRNNVINPMLAKKTFQTIATTQVEKLNSNTKSDIYISIASAFISACAYAIDPSTIPHSFDNVLSTLKTTQTKFQVLSNAHWLDIDHIKIASTFFNEPTFRSLLNDASNISFYNALFAFIGVTSRNRDITQQVIDNHLIPSMIPCLINQKTIILEGASSVFTAALALIVVFIEWAPGVLSDSESLKAVFDLIIYLQNQMKHQSKSKSKKVADAWFDKHKHCMQSLMSWIVSRLNNHLPPSDHFTRRQGSSLEIEEKSMGSGQLNFFTIGQSLLVSFNESKDGKLQFLARGPFGKSFWTVEDDYFGNIQKPERILPEPRPLEQPAAIEITPIDVELDQQIPSVGQLSVSDDLIRKKFADDFAKWLNWNQFGMYEEFGKSSPYQRPRVIDFLTTLGLVDVSNKLQIRQHTNPIDVIKKFDELERLTIQPIAVQHVLPIDKTLDFTKDLETRMTPLMCEFLQSIGEGMTINDPNLPPLKTAVPVLPMINSFAAFLLPSMATNADGAKAIYELGQSALVKIIFNETDFDLKLQIEKRSKQMILVVRPEGNGLYHVTEVQGNKDILSPFAKEETVLVHTLAFNLAVVYEEAFRNVYKKVMPDISKQRTDLIKELNTETTENKPGYSATLTQAFPMQ